VQPRRDLVSLCDRTSHERIATLFATQLAGRKRDRSARKLQIARYLVEKWGYLWKEQNG
jgi:hypothetical protein